MIALSYRRAVLRSFHSAELLDATMIFFNAPALLGLFCQLPDRHGQVIGRPILNAAVWGSDLEHLDKTVAFEMHDRTLPRDQHPSDRPVPRAIWVNQAVALELCEPMPVQAADLLHILQTGVPAIESHQFGLEAPSSRHRQHRLEMIVLRVLILLFGIDAKVTRPMGLAIRPQ